MNRNKEPVTQKALLCNIRISSEDIISQGRKNASKSASRSGISPSKNTAQKEFEAPFSKIVSTKVRISKQNNSRANSADKSASPLASGLKIKSRVHGRIDENESKFANQQELIKIQESPRKEISPNKERPLRGISKTREGQLRKEALEVVSEENEDLFRDTLNGLNKKGTMSHSKSAQRIQKEPLTPISNTKRTEFILQELFSVKSKAGVCEKGEGIESPNKKLEIETMPTFRQSDENNLSPKRQTENDSLSNNYKSPSHIRGVFMKEHIPNLERQKEQDQRKLMKEYLDSQVNEKKRIKEEEKIRQREESKKEEFRIKKEVEKINMQYEKELNFGKARQQETKADLLTKEPKNTYSRREDRIDNKNKEQERESFHKEYPSNPLKSSKTEVMKEEILNKNELIEQQTLPVPNLRKLTEENKHLRDQNFRKNELIDMLLVALKNQGKDGISASELLEADILMNDSHSRGHSRQKLLVQPKNSDNFEPNHYHKQEVSEGRSNNSPWSVEGAHFLRYETDSPGLEEPLDFDNNVQSTPYKATETLSKLVNPNGLSEIRLPAIPDFYSHRKGPSFLSSSNLHQLDSLGLGQPSSRFPTTPYTKTSPRQFSLNISSPTNSANMKQKSDIFALNPTPKPFTRMTHFSRSKLDEGQTIEPINVARSGLDFESNRISSSASQTNPKKLGDNHFLPIVQLPAFRNSTASNQRMNIEIRNPIKVVDMGNHHQIQTSRSKGGYMERPENQLSHAILEEMKDSRLQLLMKEKEPRRGDFLSIGIESNSDKIDLREDLGVKRIESLSNRNKFPKEVFCLNLRKKVGI